MYFFFFSPTGNMMKVLRGHQNWVYGCAFSPDSSILCSVGASKAVCVRVSCSLNLLNCMHNHFKSQLTLSLCSVS